MTRPNPPGRVASSPKDRAPSPPASSQTDLAELDRQLDEALEESFPSSDPIAVDPRRDG